MATKGTAKVAMARLGALVEESSVRNRANEVLVVYSVTNSGGFVPSAEYFSKEVFSKNLKTYKIVSPGMFAYNPSRINVGSVNWWNGDESVVVSPLYIVFKVDMSKIDQGYLNYFLHSSVALSQIRNLTSGSVRDSLKFSAFGKLEIPLPPLDGQRRIAGELDRICELKKNAEERLALLDQLAKSLFVEMFGANLGPEIFPLKPLSEVADVVSGITKGRKPKTSDLKSVPYMAVSNVKDGYIDWTTVKNIEATQAEIDQYRLMPDDILMTEGGDPDKVGRGALIKTPPQDCIHQNHIFRVRVGRNILTPVYFEHFLQTPHAKQYFLKSAKQTTGIASINMGQLKRLQVVIPPLNLQKKYAAFVEQLDKSEFALRTTIETLDTLYRQHLQEHFA